MASNIDLRGQGNRHHFTAQISYLDQTFLVGTPLTSTPGQPTGLLIPTAAGTYNFQIGNLPAGARILRANMVTGIAIAGSTMTTRLGTSSGDTSLTSALTTGTAVGVAPFTLSATANLYVVTEQTQIWAQLILAGTLTALQTDLILEYAVVHGPQSQF